jgi:hypothetical protein
LLSPRPIRRPTAGIAVWNSNNVLTTPNSTLIALPKTSPTIPEQVKSNISSKEDQEDSSFSGKESPIEESPTELLVRYLALHAMFSDFDIDGDGGIDFGELQNMLDHLRERNCLHHKDGTKEYIMEEFTTEVAQQVMNALDENENKCVEKHECNDWKLKVLSYPPTVTNEQTTSELKRLNYRL